MRFHLVDRVDKICYNKYIQGVKCITLADDVFDEHFPGYPIFPGSLILEGLAQMGGSFFELIFKNEGRKNVRSVLSIVNKMKFKKPVVPGDRLIYTSTIVSISQEYGVADVKAEIDGEIIASGNLLFSFVNVQNTTLQDSRDEIHGLFMKNVKIVSE